MSSTQASRRAAVAASLRRFASTPLAQFAQRQDAEEQPGAVSRREKGHDPGIGAELASFRDQAGVEQITRRHTQSSTLRPVSRSRSIVKSSTLGPPSRCALKSGLCATRAR